jgi:TolB protein
MMSKTTLKAAVVVVLAGSVGCEMAPGTYTAMGTGSEGPAGPQASGAQVGTPTATRVNPNQPTARAVPSSAAANRQLTLDPISTSLVGAVEQDQPITLHAQSNGPPSNAALNLYGEALAKSMTPPPPRGGDGSKAGGQNLTQVSFAQEGADFDPDVSPDGKRVVYASTQHRMTADIYVKNTESRVVSQLTSDPSNDVMPRISPDGNRVSFASNRAGNWDIYVMPIAGGRAIQLTNNAADDLSPSWSPDGTKLAFCRLGEVSGQWEIWTLDVGNAGVASFVCYGLFPAWCPVAGTGTNGTDKIAFQKSRERGDRAFSIWTIDYRDAQAENLTEVASTPLAACINPSWSPDGQWLAFATVPNPQQWAQSTDSRPNTADLWIIDINANSQISLSAGSAVNLMPTWGPNNRLFFVSDRGGIDNIWSMDTNQIVQLATLNMRNNPRPYVAEPSGDRSSRAIQLNSPATPTQATGQDHGAPGEKPH